MAGENFTQPGQSFLDDGWHDELMPRIAHREAVRLIQGPAWEELLEGGRLLSAGTVDAAMDHLEAAIAQAGDAEQMLPSALELLDKNRGGDQALLPGGEHGAAVTWQYRFTPPPAGWETGSDQVDSGWSSGPAPFGSYRGNLSPRSPWPQSEPDLWLRVRFDVADVPTGRLSIRAYIDDNAEVFINGVPAARGNWVGAKYQQLDLSPESAAAIRPGANVLSVHCTNVNGGSKIDVGLYVGDNRVLRERLLTAALKASPDSAALLRQRGILNVQLEHWREAALDLENLLERKTDANSIDWMQAATLHAMVVSTGNGTFDDYRRVCSRMMDRFKSSQENIEIERTMKSCSLLPTEIDVAMLPADVVTGPLDGGTLASGLVPWFHVACALADYRRGEFRAAEQRASTSLETAAAASGTARDVIRALAAAVRSLALSAQDRHDEARIDLDRAKQHLAQLVVRRPDGSLVGTSLFHESGALDHDRLIADMLIREAEGALRKSEEAPQP
jgi:tetratricopeptide (TPR) repeat protein